MDRNANAEGVDLVRKAISGPQAEAYLAADSLHREIRRLETRLAAVRRRGGAYGDVEFSRDVRSLLTRLEAGATLSGAVH